MYYKQRGKDDTVVVQKLISEAPKPITGHSAPLEKLLVDLFSKKLTGKLISRSEYQRIYEDAFSKYRVDVTNLSEIFTDPERYIAETMSGSKYKKLSYIKKHKLEAYGYLVEAVHLMEE